MKNYQLLIDLHKSAKRQGPGGDTESEKALDLGMVDRSASLKIADMIHYFCAFVLFSAFIFFTVFLFPKSKVKKGDPLPTNKWKRNFFYLLFGGAMMVCMFWIFIIRKFTERSIFWPEAIALEFFAMSWLLKGRADWTMLQVGRRILRYGLHPGELAGKVWKVFRNYVSCHQNITVKAVVRLSTTV